MRAKEGMQAALPLGDQADAIRAAMVVGVVLLDGACQRATGRRGLLDADSIGEPCEHPQAAPSPRAQPIGAGHEVGLHGLLA